MNQTGIKRIKVGGQIYFKNMNNNSSMYVLAFMYLVNESTKTILKTLSTAAIFNVSAGSYGQLHFADTEYNVNDSDTGRLIGIQIYKSMSNGQINITDEPTRTYLTITEVE